MNPTTAPTASFEFDTRSDAVAVATRMMLDGWDVRIAGNVVIADCPVHVFTIAARVCGLDY